MSRKPTWHEIKRSIGRENRASAASARIARRGGKPTWHEVKQDIARTGGLRLTKGGNVSKYQPAPYPKADLSRPGDEFSARSWRDHVGGERGVKLRAAFKARQAERRKSSGSGGEVEVSGHTRGGHEVSGYTRGKPSR